LRHIKETRKVYIFFFLKPVLFASLIIKSSKLGGVLLGKELSFLTSLYWHLFP